NRFEAAQREPDNDFPFVPVKESWLSEPNLTAVGQFAHVHTPVLELTPVENRSTRHFDNRYVFRLDTIHDAHRDFRRLNPVLIRVVSVAADASVAHKTARAEDWNLGRTGDEDQNIENGQTRIRVLIILTAVKNERSLRKAPHSRQE